MNTIDIQNIKELSKAAIKAGLFENLEQAAAMHQSIQSIESFYLKNSDNGNEKENTNNREKQQK